MSDRFGIDIQPGDFNEQVLVSGMGDLSDVKIGARVVFDSGVELEVVEPAFPCARLETHNKAPGMIRALTVPQEEGKTLSRRGLLTRVLQVGDLEPGMELNIIQPEEKTNPV